MNLFFWEDVKLQGITISNNGIKKNCGVCLAHQAVGIKITESNIANAEIKIKTFEYVFNSLRKMIKVAIDKKNANTKSGPNPPNLTSVPANARISAFVTITGFFHVISFVRVILLDSEKTEI